MSFLPSLRLGCAAKDAEGNLPLHYAAFSEAPTGIFQALVTAYKAGTREKNKYDELAVQLVFKAKQRNMDTVNLLLDSAWELAGGTTLVSE